MKFLNILCTFVLLIQNAVCFHIDNIQPPQSKTKFVETLVVGNHFKQVPSLFKKYTVITEPLNLQQVAKDVLHYFNTRGDGSHNGTNPEGFQVVFGVQDVKQTLQFIIDTIEEDKQSGTFRILDPIFLKHHFYSYAWTADWQTAQMHDIAMPHDGRIRLTSYGILSVSGSHKKTAQYPCGIYYLNDHDIRTKYTKHQILGGVLERPENIKKRKALAWVSRQSLEDALMQGTVLVNFKDGGSKIFNVHVHNNIPYNRALKNVLGQKRYWFFKEIQSTMHHGLQIVDRFKMRKGVVFAGDLHHIGIGKLIALTYEHPQTKHAELRLGILADTGGAFHNNLYQLDLFGGIFENQSALRTYLRLLPTAATAYVLCKKN